LTGESSCFGIGWEWSTFFGDVFILTIGRGL
jgi:hypothetical protein